MISRSPRTSVVNGCQPMDEYPAILKQIRAVQLASHGCKRAKEKRLVKMRLASLKRELGVSRLRRSGRLRGVSAQ
jgi:hypothetical protein